jgi:hypothetical protein
MSTLVSVSCSLTLPAYLVLPICLIALFGTVSVFCEKFCEYQTLKMDLNFQLQLASETSKRLQLERFICAQVPVVSQLSYFVTEGTLNYK